MESDLRIIEPFIGEIHHNYEELLTTDYGLRSVLNPSHILSSSNESLALDTSIPEDIINTENKRNEVLCHAVEYLKEFENSLNKPEAAIYIHLAKKKLEESWDFIAHEDREIGMMISAIEDSIRQRKWHDYKAYQVEVIRDILQDCVDGKVRSQKDVLERTSKLYKHDIDIFPSATDEVYEEDE